MKCNCKHWSSCGLRDGGRCGLGVGGGKPSLGVCERCVDYVGPALRVIRPPQPYMGDPRPDPIKDQPCCDPPLPRD